MDSVISTFIAEQKDVFPSDILNTSMYSKSDEKGFWENPPELPSEITHPGYLFYKYPAKVVKRERNSGFTIKPTERVDSLLFSFDPQINQELAKKSLEEKVKGCPPLESMYFKNPPENNKDGRYDVENIEEQLFDYYSFSGLPVLI